MKKKTQQTVDVAKLVQFSTLVFVLVTFMLVAIFLLSSGDKKAIPEILVSAGGTTGNGAPNGDHFNLNIHGVANPKTADLTSSDTHNIFVPLTGKCRIDLNMGDYQVLDGNCTDGRASFQLPNPDPTNSGVTSYSVWARALGKPGGSSNMTSCAEQEVVDPVTGQTSLATYCSVYTLSLNRTKGKSTFGDVSQYLLYVYADINADGVVERLPLFDERLQGYYWDYDNKGMKLVQLRFYPVASTVAAQ